MDSCEPVLQLREISKSFSGIRVLNQINLDLYPGEVHCLVGENGAGKSTLIKIISGAYQPDLGTISYMGRQVRNVTPHWARENGITTIYQEIDLIPSLSAAENISLGCEPLRGDGSIDWNKVQQKALVILKDMGANVDINIPVGRMKVAYQQMVAIAKALSLNSQILILDEPTAVFTSSEIDLLFRIILKLKSQGIAIVFISHHLDEIFQIGDRVTVLRDGNLVKSGRVHEFDKKSLVRAMVGRDIDFSQRSNHRQVGDEALRVNNLTRNGVVENINFALHRGEILGVAGLVGAGRTEMARLLIGADRPDKGDIYLYGKQVRFKSTRHSLKLGLGMLPESRKEEGLVQVRSMAENMAYGLIARCANFGLVRWKQVKNAIPALIEALNIRPKNPNIQVIYMSGGNQQKVVLSRLLAAKCEVMILDEPTRGVDVGARMEIYKLIQHLKEEGKAILMISSDLPEILTQADRILVMAGGKIVGEITGEDATEEKILSIALQVDSEEIHESA